MACASSCSQASQIPARFELTRSSRERGNEPWGALKGNRQYGFSRGHSISHRPMAPASRLNGQIISQIGPRLGLILRASGDAGERRSLERVALVRVLGILFLFVPGVVLLFKGYISPKRGGVVLKGSKRRPGSSFTDTPLTSWVHPVCLHTPYSMSELQLVNLI